MIKTRWFIFLFIIMVVGCTTATPAPISDEKTPTIAAVAEATFTPEVIPPTPTLTATLIPDPDYFVQKYLDYWKADDYPAMYAMLTAVSTDAITEEDFTQRYRRVLAEAAVGSLDYEILSILERTSQSAEVSYRVILHSVLVGEIQRDTIMNLSLEDGNWHVQWADEIILPELAGGNYLWMDRHIPARANIYGQDGNAIVAYAEAASIGIIPSRFEDGKEDDILRNIQRMTGIHPAALYYQYYDYPPGAEWLVYVAEVPREFVDDYYEISNGYDDGGLIMWPFESRFYYNNGIAPQMIGYVSLIQAEEEEEYLRLGYSRDEKVGRQGIEKWGETHLGGTRGGTLYVIGPTNEVVTQIADVSAQPAQAIYTTIDTDLQLAAQEMLLKYFGSIVVMEVDTGRVLALASSPGFDPNAFEPDNANSRYQLEDIYDPYGGQPLYNRATRGQYPLGSVFKIITTAAALESGLYTRETTYQCEYNFTEIPSISPRHDWTWEHCQQELLTDDECETKPSGLLNLPEGLMRSCNPYFWHIGLDLYRQGIADGVSEMARGFGLGSPTGIEGVEEEAGNIPDPGDEVEAINLAIGQGDTLVTPLQVAQFMAALGNGGTMYQPQVIDRIAPPDAEAIYEFAPIEKGKLPISPETLAVLKEGMVAVVQDKRGTASHILGTYSKNLYAMAGKTGTAESGLENSHAWFAGYTLENRDNKPDIAIVVIAEHAGEGSEIAAPMFRGIVQYYFEGRRNYLLPWESSIGVLALPEIEEVTTTEANP
jgi:penicillin-binding protein 2